MEPIQLTCIVCPAGCLVQVDRDPEGKVSSVKGHECTRGYDYALQEALDPRRVLTTTVRVEGAAWPLVAVRTRRPIPRGSLMAAMKELQRLRLEHPVAPGEVVAQDVAGTGVEVVVTRSSR